MRTSYSALETYKLCPQKYKFQEIDRLPAKKSKAAVFGTHVHAVLRFMFSRDPLFPTLDEVLAFFREHFPAPEKMDVTPEEKQLYVAEGERMLKNFYAKNAPWNFSVVDLESRFEVLLEDAKRGETHMLAGRMDRIDKTGEGYEVIDYKTSRKMPAQAAVDSDLQMSIYALGLQTRWPHVKPENITLSLYFLKHGEKLSTTRTPEATAATRRDVLRTLSDIQGKLSRGERFEPTPGSWCDFCSYKPICPAWKHLYRGDLLVAYHGSWNRSSPIGYKVVRHKFDDRGNYEGVEDFITGWLTAKGALGRPVDIVFRSDGSAYISDDKAGVIYRVRRIPRNR